MKRGAKFKSLLLCLAVIGFLGLFVGRHAAADDLADKVQARYNGLKTISAGFKQYSMNKISSMTEWSQGTVYISKPGKMRWEYEKPERRLIISDGENVWAYFPGQNQVYVAELNDAYVTRTPLAFLAGKGNLKEDFKITTSTVTDDERGVIHRLDLEPNVPRMNLSRLVLEVDEKHYLVVKSDLYDSMDNLISIRFNQILMNPHIPKTFFQFTPPKGVEIINMGEGN